LVSNAAVVALGLSLGLSVQWLVVRIANRPQLLAQPNERSSHKDPTPTMGGIMIAVVMIGYLLQTDDESAQLFAVALAIVAGVGLWDDLKDLPSWLRLVVHIGTSAFAISTYAVSGEALAPGLLFIAVIGLAGFVNLYNFMDGIDGIAASQCLVFCVGVQIVAGPVPGATGSMLWLLSGVTLAFLAFNWPPARIFMGDIGSGFLGLAIGTVAIHLAVVAVVPLVASLILLAAFWFDATYTLCVRIVTRQEFTQAHRSHLYQRLAVARGHLWTTIAYLIYAFVWLVPLAWLSATVPALEMLTLIVAIAPLALMCWRVRAGWPAG